MADPTAVETREGLKKPANPPVSGPSKGAATKSKTEQQSGALPNGPVAWNTLMTRSSKDIVLSLTPETFTPENVNDRVYDLLKTFGKTVPYFQKLYDAAKEKGYKFELLSDNSPEMVRDFFKSQNAISVTDKESNVVYFNLPTLEKLWKKHQDQQSFGLAFVEQMAHEGMHLLKDNLKTPEDVAKTVAVLGQEVQHRDMKAMIKKVENPTPLEQAFQADVIEDYTAAIVGNLVGYSDNNLEAALQLKALPNENMTQGRLISQMFGAMDKGLPKYFPVLTRPMAVEMNGIDVQKLGDILEIGQNAPQAIKERAMDFFFSGKIEKGFIANLKDYGIASEDFQMPVLGPREKVAELQTLMKKEAKKEQ